MLLDFYIHKSLSLHITNSTNQDRELSYCFVCHKHQRFFMSVQMQEPFRSIAKCTRSFDLQLQYQESRTVHEQLVCLVRCSRSVAITIWHKGQVSESAWISKRSCSFLLNRVGPSIYQYQLPRTEICIV